MPTFVADEIVTAAKLNAATARDWTTWSPTPTGFTVGNGTQTARYIQVGKLVTCYYSLVFGSTSAVTAEVSMTLPVTASSSVNTTIPIGNAGLFDSGTSAFAGTVTLASTTTIQIRSLNAAGTYANRVSLSSTVPMTWAVNDVLSFQATYEAA